MRSKLAALLKKEGFLGLDTLPQAASAAGRVGGNLFSGPNYQMPGNIRPNVPWAESDVGGAVSFLPWMFRSRTAPALANAASIAPAAALVNWLSSTSQFGKMERAARRQGFNLGYNNPFINTRSRRQNER